MGLPLGFRFDPTGEELLHYLLKRQNGKPLPEVEELIRDINIYGQDDPRTLFDVGDGATDCTFFVFTNSAKEPTKAASGYWCGRSQEDVKDNKGNLIGIEKYYTFNSDCYEEEEEEKNNNNKRIKNYEMGNWSMHEFSLENSIDGTVVCVVNYSASSSGNPKKRRLLPRDDDLLLGTEPEENSWLLSLLEENQDWISDAVVPSLLEDYEKDWISDMDEEEEDWIADLEDNYWKSDVAVLREVNRVSLSSLLYLLGGDHDWISDLIGPENVTETAEEEENDHLPLTSLLSLFVITLPTLEIASQTRIERTNFVPPQHLQPLVLPVTGDAELFSVRFLPSLEIVSSLAPAFLIMCFQISR